MILAAEIDHSHAEHSECDDGTCSARNKASMAIGCVRRAKTASELAALSGSDANGYNEQHNCHDSESRGEGDDGADAEEGDQCTSTAVERRDDMNDSNR